MKSPLTTGLIILVIILTVCVSYLIIETYYLKTQFNNKIEALSNDIIILNSKINNTNYKLNKLNTSMMELSYKVNNTVIKQSNEISTLMSNLDEYNNELESKLKWISMNSEINESPKYMYYPFDACVSNNEINLGCVGYVLFDDVGLHYISDPNKTDILYNLTQIYDRGGGDCEDLSLVFAASTRYLMSEYHTDKFVSWTNGNNKFIIYKTNNEEYYFDNAKAVHFTARYVYVTCYDINATTGHCIVALCNNKTSGNFSNCTMVEPQQYGKIKGPITNLELYISSNNLCMPFKGKNTCFTDFENQIEELLNKYNN